MRIRFSFKNVYAFFQLLECPFQLSCLEMDVLLTGPHDIGCVSLKKNPRKQVLCFFIKQINPRSLGSWCIKGTKESTSVPLMHHDPRDLGLIYVIKKHKIHFRILLDFRIQSWIFLVCEHRRQCVRLMCERVFFHLAV